MTRIIITAVALVCNSWVMASQELVNRVEEISSEVDCLRFASRVDSTSKSINDLPDRYMLFLAGQATGRRFKDQNALANWFGRNVEDGFRDRLMSSLIAKAFQCPTDRNEILSIQIQQFKKLSKAAARQHIVDEIYVFLAERLKAAKLLSRGVVELDLIFQSDGAIELRYVHIDEGAGAVQHEISKAFYDMGPLKKIIWYEEQHSIELDPYRLKVRVGR